jgi:hypothetical protein
MVFAFQGQGLACHPQGDSQEGPEEPVERGRGQAGILGDFGESSSEHDGGLQDAQSARYGSDQGHYHGEATQEDAVQESGFMPQRAEEVMITLRSF